MKKNRRLRFYDYVSDITFRFQFCNKVHTEHYFMAVAIALSILQFQLLLLTLSRVLLINQNVSKLPGSFLRNAMHFFICYNFWNL